MALSALNALSVGDLCKRDIQAEIPGCCARVGKRVGRTSSTRYRRLCLLVCIVKNLLKELILCLCRVGPTDFSRSYDLAYEYSLWCFRLCMKLKRKVRILRCTRVL